MERKNDTHNEEMKNLKLNQKDLSAKVAQYYTFLEVDQNIEERKKALKWIPVAQKELELTGIRGNHFSEGFSY